MKVGIIGASGFVGTRLMEVLESKGHEVVPFSRREREGWRVVGETIDLSHLDAVVNLAGAPVNKRWTDAYKVTMRESRVGVTDAIVAAMAEMTEGERPEVLVNASGVGYYGDRGEDELDESGSLGEGYLAELCRDWEGTAMKAEGVGVRSVALRIGVVLGKGGEAWEQLKRVFSLGGGGRLGTGKQWMSWIHVEDLAGVICFALENDGVRGGVNAVAPNPERNEDFTQKMGQALKRPTWIPAPAWGLRLVLGEFASALLGGQKGVPKALVDAGYEFQFETLEGALRDLTT